MSAIYRFEVHQMDVETAFLNAALEKEVNIRAPESFLLLLNNSTLIYRKQSKQANKHLYCAT